ncbi:MAG: hypothetical protein JW929_04435 [Anaerolineales bacterium]|nr:hypothetical protein [Anaerolineales bacterium]
MESSRFFAFLNRWAVALLPLLYGAIFWGWFSERYSPGMDSGRTGILLILIAGFAAFSLSARLRNFTSHRRFHRWIILPVVLIIVGFAYQPQLPFLRSHAGSFLSTVSDVLHGNFVLVDTLSEYGVGVVYFLTAAFRIFRIPVSYPGFVFLLNILYLLQFALLFCILLNATRSLCLSLTGLAAVLFFAILAVTWPSMLCIPTQSPLRYGWSYLALAVRWVGLGRSDRKWRICELALIGAAALWGLEAFAYTILCFNGTVFTGEVLFSLQWAEGLRRFLRRLAIQIGRRRCAGARGGYSHLSSPVVLRPRRITWTYLSRSPPPERTARRSIFTPSGTPCCRDPIL